MALLCGLVAFTEAREPFYSAANIQNVLRHFSLLAVFAIGETVVIIAGGIDLSLGSLIAFSGMLMAAVAVSLSATVVDPVAVALGVLVALLVSLTVGAGHAAFIHRLRLPPFVVTLASLLILRSAARLINNRAQISIQQFDGLRYLATGSLFAGTPLEVPVPLVILALVALAVSVALSRTRVGRYLYSVGCNEDATRLSGVSVFRVKCFAYGGSAVLGGLAGVLWAAYSGQGDPMIAEGWELDAVAASVVGGANLNGGQGSVVGTILGAALLHLVFSAINMTLTNPDLWRGAVVGGILLSAVLVTAVRSRRT